MTFAKTILLAILLFQLVNTDEMQVKAEAVCCSRCGEYRKDTTLYGTEPIYFKLQSTEFIRRSSSLD